MRYTTKYTVQNLISTPLKTLFFATDLQRQILWYLICNNTLIGFILSFV